MKPIGRGPEPAIGHAATSSGLHLARTPIRACSIIATAILAAAVSTACGTSQSTALKGNEPFVLPVLTAETGPGAVYGVLNLDAVRLAAQEINAKGGISGHPLQIKPYNTQSNAPQTAELTSSLPKDTLIVEGPDLSTEAKAMFPVAKSEKIPVIAGGVSDTSIVNTGQPWTFDTFIPAQVELPANVGGFLKRVPARTFASIIDTQDDAAKVQGQLVVNEFRRRAVQQAKSVSVTTDQPTYSSAVASIEATHPQAVVLSGNPVNVASMINTLRSTGFAGPVFLPTVSFAPRLVNLVGKSAGNIYIAGEYWAGSSSGTNPQFLKGFEAKSHGEPPGPAGAGPYEAIYLAVQAVEQTKALSSNATISAKRDAIRKYIAHVAGFKGVLGEYSMAPGGYFTGPSILLTLSNGKLSPAG